MLLALFVLAQAQPDPELQKELEKAIQADQQAAQQKQQQQRQEQPAPPPRGSQSLNPDISAILDADFGYYRRAPRYLNGDDPNLHADSAHALGFTAQEVELAFSAIVDPYFRGDVFLTIPNLEGLEVEEAFATTTSLPWNLQVKAGSFRSAFGRQNGQHLHVQDFTRRPLINAAFLGDDGLRGPGAQVSWLAPLPFYLTLYAEAFSLSNDPAAFGEPVPPPVPTFGSDGPRRPTATAEAKVFLPMSEAWSFYGGLSFASGQSPGLFVAQNAVLGAGRDSQLFGADAYFKWKPPNVAQSYGSLAIQAEWILRHLSAGDGFGDEWDGGAYAQVVAQFSRRWFLGLRGDYVGLPTSSITPATARGAVSLTFQGSEFMRIRAYAEMEKGDPAHVQPDWAPAAFLQLEISIGAHGAHPF